MEPVTVITHSDFLRHTMGQGHPERPERLNAILAPLADLPNLERWDDVELATESTIAKMHSIDHLEKVFSAIPKRGLAALDPDTFLCPASGDAAKRAVGAATLGVEMLLTGKTRRVFGAVRPPGHHAEADEAMGFCFFNNTAIAACHARDHYGLARVAVVDFDVHHGNGTEAIFAGREGYFYASTHQSPCYPGTGCRHQIETNLVNVPLAPGTGGKEAQDAWRDYVVPSLHAFAPQLLIISAGFDADARDPLASLNWNSEDFHAITGMLTEVAERHADGRILSLLEGGYDLHALADGGLAHIQALSGQDYSPT